jgi:hypothetical protein
VCDFNPNMRRSDTFLDFNNFSFDLIACAQLHGTPPIDYCCDLSKANFRSIVPVLLLGRANATALRDDASAFIEQRDDMIRVSRAYCPEKAGGDIALIIASRLRVKARQLRP